MGKPPYIGRNDADWLFHYYCEYEDNHKPRAAGFVWNKELKCWRTPFLDVVQRVLPKGSEARVALEREEEAQVQQSFAITSSLYPPVPPGKKLYDFQRAGVEVLARRKDAILGDPMGLGKTITTVALVNYLDSLGQGPDTILIICPAVGKLHWEATWHEWATTGRTVAVVHGRRDWRVADVIIVNYDVVSHHQHWLTAAKFGLLVLDEAHYIKNGTAGRTKLIVGRRSNRTLLPHETSVKADRKLAITGTLIKNRPEEVFVPVRYLLPDAFPSKNFFGKQYCGAWYDPTEGWNYKGASQLPRLQRVLRSSLLVRRSKESVLPELPPKVWQIISIDPTSDMLKVLRKEKEVWKQAKQRLGLSMADDSLLSNEDYQALVRAMRGGDKEVFDNMAIARHETALAKVPAVITHLQNAIESSGKVVVFCHHRDVARKLQDAFPDHFILIGGATPKARREAELRFQNTDVPLFIGNIKAAGEVITLTAASHVVFAEISWVPGDLSQAEDRCHRIGTVDSVLVQHLVMAGSIDEKMANAVVTKQKVIAEALG